MTFDPIAKIEPGVIGTIDAGSKIHITYIANATREIRWGVKLIEPILWVPNGTQAHPWEFSLHGHIIEAGFVPGIHERLSNQRDSIDRLTRHLKGHCPKLMGTGECQYLPG